MPATILLLNGPNLNLLGRRQPGIYGHETLADVEAACRAVLAGAGLALEARQSNHEGALVNGFHDAREEGAREGAAGIVINLDACSHTSVAILDALNAFEGPVEEVHVSNIHKREAFRHHSFVSGRAEGMIAGFGVQGYGPAMQRMVARVAP